METIIMGNPFPRSGAMPLEARHLRPFAQVREHVEADDHGKWDEIVPRRDLRLREGQLALPSADGQPQSDSERRLDLSPLAQSHLATRLGIPASYFRALPPILQDQNANFWLQNGSRPALLRSSLSQSVLSRSAASRRPIADEDDTPLTRRDLRRIEGEKWRIRSRFGTARAVLSESYSPLDNGPLCDAVAGLLQPGHRVGWFGLGDEAFHLHIVDPHKVREVLPGDDYFCGVYVGNSEVGARSVQVEAYLMRLICSNGLVATLGYQKLLRRRHVHLEHDRFERALREAFALALQVADDFIGTLRGSTRQVVPDVPSTLEHLTHHYGLGETTRQMAIQAIERESAQVQETAYGVVQGLTEAAQLLPDSQRHDLETLAGLLARNGIPKWALRPVEQNGPGQPARSNRSVSAWSADAWSADDWDEFEASASRDLEVTR